MKRLALLALPLALAACEQQAADTPAEQGGAASGEVLAGSISDAMIPLDQLSSQAPLAPRQAVPVDNIDAEQPEVTPLPGIEGAPGEQPASAVAPAADQPQE